MINLISLNTFGRWVGGFAQSVGLANPVRRTDLLATGRFIEKEQSGRIKISTAMLTLSFSPPLIPNHRICAVLKPHFYDSALHQRSLLRPRHPIRQPKLSKVGDRFPDGELGFVAVEDDSAGEESVCGEATGEGVEESRFVGGGRSHEGGEGSRLCISNETFQNISCFSIAETSPMNSGLVFSFHSVSLRGLTPPTTIPFPCGLLASISIITSDEDVVVVAVKSFHANMHQFCRPLVEREERQR
nr:hypothetical protein Itr_chr01CG15360 [Ipomoea trifida]